MKYLYITITSIILISCNNNFNNATEYYEKAEKSNSQVFLDDAKFELGLINESKKNDEKVIELFKKISLLQKKFDSITILENIKRIEYENKTLKYNIKIEKEKESIAKENARKEKIKYPNMIGKWRTYQTDYLKILNGIVRIYNKNGIFYISKIFDKDGSEYTKRLRKSANKYYEIRKSDYVILKSNGDLEHRDKEGYLMTSKKYDDSFTPTIKKLTDNIKSYEIIGENIFKFRFNYGLEDFVTMQGTNNEKWITYYPKYDLTLTSNKQSDQIEDFKFGN